MTEHEQNHDLLPCPFCGNDHIEISARIFTGGRMKYSAYCGECGTDVAGHEWITEGKGEPGFHTEAEAAAAWNRRGDEVAQ